MENTPTTPIIDALKFKIMLSLKAQQKEQAGIIDYERLDEELTIFLSDFVSIEEELEISAQAFREVVAERDDAREQLKAVKSLYDTVCFQRINFRDWAQN